VGADLARGSESSLPTLWHNMVHDFDEARRWRQRHRWNHRLQVGRHTPF
jgi:hypothetical protein